jgi:hypothetical protein
MEPCADTPTTHAASNSTLFLWSIGKETVAQGEFGQQTNIYLSEQGKKRRFPTKKESERRRRRKEEESERQLA